MSDKIRISWDTGTKDESVLMFSMGKDVFGIPDPFATEMINIINQGCKLQADNQRLLECLVRINKPDCNAIWSKINKMQNKLMFAEWDHYKDEIAEKRELDTAFEIGFRAAQNACKKMFLNTVLDNEATALIKELETTPSDNIKE